jgi:hypothetical protein
VGKSTRSGPFRRWPEEWVLEEVIMISCSRDFSNMMCIQRDDVSQNNDRSNNTLSLVEARILLFVVIILCVVVQLLVVEIPP